jgi:hypothetical protein
VDPRIFRRRLVRGSLLLLLAGGVAFGVYVLTVVPPTPDSWYPGCMFHKITGLDCPGCGMTRAVHAALNGNFRQALAYNILAPILIPAVGLAALSSLWLWVWGTTPRFPTPPRWVPITFGVLVGVFWIVRNIPVYPFTLLAPHEI